MLSLSSPYAPFTTALDVAFRALRGGEKGEQGAGWEPKRLTAVVHRRAGLLISALHRLCPLVRSLFEVFGVGEGGGGAGNVA